MRNYSERPYSPEELAAALTGLCKSIGEPSDKIVPNLAVLPGIVNSLSLKYNSPEKANGEAYYVGAAIQSLIDTLIKNEITDIDSLKKCIDSELSKLPPSQFIDYFTGEKKFDF